MNTYEFETTVRIMVEAETEEDAHTHVFMWLGSNVLDHGSIERVR